MAATLDFKRPITPEELERQLEPLLKRYKVDVPIIYPGDETSGGTSSSWEDPMYGRRQAMEDLQEPEWKRFRVSDSMETPGVDPQEAATRREDSVRRWSETIVRNLHGCPSVEEARRRCGQSLLDFGDEVRQTTAEEAAHAAELRRQAREAEREQQPPTAEPVSDLHHKNRILMRAVYHLAERCKRAEVAAAEVPALQQSLEESREGTRRLTHANSVLQEHLKISLNYGCR